MKKEKVPNFINEIELSKKFEEIFINQETENFYSKWHERKQKERDTRNLVQKSLPLIIFIFIVLIVISIPVYIFRDRVEQTTQKIDGENVYFLTDVWINGEIAKQWSTLASEMTDSIKTAQYNAALKILNALKK